MLRGSCLVHIALAQVSPLSVRLHHNNFFLPPVMGKALLASAILVYLHVFFTAPPVLLAASMISLC